MFLYASDWTTPSNLAWLEKNGFPNSGKLIKIFASTKEPSEILRREIKTEQETGGEFLVNVKYHARGPWLPSDLEYMLLGHFKLDEQTAANARALFRFANRDEVGIADLAMQIKNAESGRWHYSLPLDIIDGLDEALERGRTTGLHLDVFTPRSLERVTKIFELDNPNNFATRREVVKIAREKEVPTVSKERG